MDFINRLPKVMVHYTIIVVIDHFTKYSHFLLLSHQYKAKSVATLLVREIVHLYGFPKSIVSDRDRVFVSQFWQELFKL